MEAFLEHYRLLRALARSGGDGHALNGSERDALAAMERLAQFLSPAEREALFASAPDSATARRRQRAELRLRRALRERGILQG